jgi:D-alanyl-D-alanine-carboxypeptidase/D-alanyl-D-alanine-endopeptidase
VKLHRFIVGLLIVCVAWFAAATRASAEALVAQDKLDALARPLVDGGWTYGLAVGLISETGTQVVGYGRVSENDGSIPGPDTEFEIGSVSKVFTGLLLAQMVEEHLVELNEPVQKLLGDSMTVPQGEREITLVDLATHSSGLPRMPDNFNPKDLTNPYADYSVEQLGKFISAYKLKRQPGARSDYSNLGVGLLGHALALKSGSTYESLLRRRICDPLGMSDTCITLSDGQKARLAQAHDCDGRPESNWDLPTFAGAGAIRSTAADMLKFLAASIGLVKTQLDAAIAASHIVHFETPNGPHDVALCWQVQRKPPVIWHNGQTGGYHSYAAFSPDKRRGVVVLATTTSGHVDALGNRLLKLLTDGEAEPLKLPRAIAIAPEDLEPLVADYKLNLLATVHITRDRERLFLQLTGQPKVRFYPESKTRFFCHAVEAAITFEADEAGQIKQLVLHQNGQDLPAPRAK